MTTPSPSHAGLTFFPIPKFTDPQIAFGADASAYFNRRDLPKVPYQHKDAAMSLFYSGGALPDFDPRVDRQAAMRAVRAWLTSFAPAHESKEATVGYAFWVWSTPAAIDEALSKAEAA